MTVGEILLDDVEIEDYRLRNLRRHVAQVTQHVTLFNDTIANNIAYGDLAGAPRADIEKAATDAYAMDFIAQMPQGPGYPGRGKRRAAVRRPASAPGDCPCPAEECTRC